MSKRKVSTILFLIEVEAEVRVEVLQTATKPLLSEYCATVIYVNASHHCFEDILNNSLGIWPLCLNPSSKACTGFLLGLLTFLGSS